MPIEPMYSTRQVAAALDVSPSHVRNLIKAGRLTATNVGIGRTKWRISELAVAECQRMRDAEPDPSPGRPNLVLIQTQAA